MRLLLLTVRPATHNSFFGKKKGVVYCNFLLQIEEKNRNNSKFYKAVSSSQFFLSSSISQDDIKQNSSLHSSFLINLLHPINPHHHFPLPPSPTSYSLSIPNDPSHPFPLPPPTGPTNPSLDFPPALSLSLSLFPSIIIPAHSPFPLVHIPIFEPTRHRFRQPFEAIKGCVYIYLQLLFMSHST